ncbi:DUF6526 family protein [Oceanobacillus sp. FSL K6-2867]|uniref:DUF6526 family protein n=1 Tax=Oceanobacillus sp. FSL K6-2867 TaxID=2954748 RepID=UPI0030DA7A10
MIPTLVCKGGSFIKQTQSADNQTATAFFPAAPDSDYLLAGITSMITVIAQGNFTFSHALLLGLILTIITGILARKYALSLQDRLIWTEETLAYIYSYLSKISPS